MNYDYPQTDLSRGILSGLFAGLVAIAANIVFVIIFRSVTQFYEFNGLDITVIVFGSLAQSIVCGLFFYWFIHYMNHGINMYRAMVLIITILIVVLGLMLRHSVMGEVPQNFKMMVVGTQIIIGGLATFLIPYLSKHDKIIS